MPRGRIARDLVGASFNRWTVIAREQNSASGQVRWMCICQCGRLGIVQQGSLKDGQSQSCGCLKVETIIRRSTKHGHATRGISKTYHSWAGMTARCTAPKHLSYPIYGGRGIKICKRWMLFKNFLDDMGKKPPGMSLERRDVHGHYNKQNCFWATPKQQANNKRNSLYLTIDGTTKTIAEWCLQMSINRNTVDDRLRSGWNAKDALFTPAGTSADNAKSRMLTHRGKTMCVSEWARHLGIPKQRIYQRLHRGKPTKDALHV